MYILFLTNQLFSCFSLISATIFSNASIVVVFRSRLCVGLGHN
nr:MAG TPA: hypothetical protein [Caudoviricetes sp.]